MAGLTSILGNLPNDNPASAGYVNNATSGVGMGGGAQAGLDQAQESLSNIGQAVSQIEASMKKGGTVKKYVKGGKINLDSCGVSTHQKSKKSSSW